MSRFLQQLDLGKGDYSKDRHEWVDKTSLEDIKKLSRKKAGAMKKTAGKSRRTRNRDSK
ncbi:MAG: hypothetical protein HS101_10100 [Planctomycetia bacterium]|jgi:hypothetical protein|nr:hypothetical protein [Planctomycetia bacterium]MCC7316813.1 hypothetical protein [Planctomycetota bacterium]